MDTPGAHREHLDRSDIAMTIVIAFVLGLYIGQWVLMTGMYDSIFTQGLSKREIALIYLLAPLIFLLFFLYNLIMFLRYLLRGGISRGINKYKQELWKDLS